MHSLGNLYGTTSIGERGQVVIPKKAREELGFKKGDNFVVVEKHGMLVLAPAELLKSFINDVTEELNKLK